MPPNSDAEDYIDIDDMEEVEVDDDLPHFEDDDILDAVEDIELVQEGAETVDESKIIFELHEASVFSINVSKNDSSSCLVVTGGEDDKAYVWNYQTAQCLFECTGHTDSVICCDFSMDGKYVMSADMSGNVRVFTTTDGQCAWEYQCGDLEWCKWHSSAHVLFAGTNCGDVYMWKIPGGDCKIYANHGSKTTCGRLTATGTELVVGYEDGSVKKWDLKNVSPLFHYKPVVVEGEDTDPVLCLDLLNSGVNSGNLIVVGTEGGCVILINSHTGKQIGSFTLKQNQTNEGGMNNAAGEMDEELDEGIEISHAVESVAFSPCGCFIAAGSVNAMLCIWDISLQRLRHTCTSPAGVTKLIWTDVEANIISACLDGAIRMWDHKNGEMVKEMTGNLGNILDIAITSDGRNILTAGDDCTARVFENEPQPS